MGLFGKDFDWGEAALGLFADPQVMATRQRRQADARVEEQEAKRRGAYETAIDGDPSLSPEDKVYAKARPEAFMDAHFRRGQFGQGNRASPETPSTEVDGFSPAQPIDMSDSPAGWEAEPDASSGEFNAISVGGFPRVLPFPSVTAASIPRLPQGQGQAPFYRINSPSRQRFGGAIPVRTPGQHSAIASGTEYFAPDGSVRRKR